MHGNENFFTKATPEQIRVLLAEAEAAGKQYVQALKDQLRRLDITIPETPPMANPEE